MPQTLDYVRKLPIIVAIANSTQNDEPSPWLIGLQIQIRNSQSEIFLSLYSLRGDSVVPPDYVQLLSGRVARKQRRCFHEVDKRSRPSTLFFVGAINQAPQFTQVYQYLRHQPATLPANGLRRRKGMKAFKELTGRLETRVTMLDRVNRFVRSNREDVGHRDTFLFCGPWRSGFR